MVKAEQLYPVDQIIPGDCIKVMDALPEKSVDIVFADPPYNLQLEKTLWRPDASRVNGVEEAWDQFTGFEAYDHFTMQWLVGCRRVLKDTGTIWVIGSYHNIFRVGKIMQDLGFWILNDVVWIKNNPMPNFHGVRFTNAHETLIWAQKIKGKRYTFNYKMMKSANPASGNEDGLQMRSDWRLPLCKGKERLKINGEKAHPTQKPEALLERIILSSTKPGDLILDPFLGSGTTGAVAKRLGRHWLGIETDSGYIALAQNRIDSVTQQEWHQLDYQEQIVNKEKRIPFRALLENGWLKEGQVLYFDRDYASQATIMADGRILCGDYVGSIHMVGRALSQAPCNGWLAWYYMDDMSGNLLPIDTIRVKIRELMQGEAS